MTSADALRETAAAARGVTKEELQVLPPKAFAAWLRVPENAERLAHSVDAANVGGGAVADLLFKLPVHIEVKLPAELAAFQAPSDVAAIVASKAVVAELQGGSDPKELREAVEALSKHLATYRDGATDTYDLIHALPGVVEAGSKTFSKLYGAACGVVRQQEGFAKFGTLMGQIARLLPKEKPLQSLDDPIELRERGLVVLEEHYAPFLNGSTRTCRPRRAWPVRWSQRRPKKTTALLKSPCSGTTRFWPGTQILSKTWCGARPRAPRCSSCAPR